MLSWAPKAALSLPTTPGTVLADQSGEGSGTPTVGSTMPDWARLGGELAVRSRDAAEVAQQAFDRHLAQQAYRRWASEGVFLVIHQLHDELTARAVDFERNVGTSYRLESPRRVRLGEGANDRCVLSLSFAGATVDVYSQWTPGAPPSVHLLLSRQHGGRPARLVCVPGAWLARSDDGAGFDLRAFSPERTNVSLEQLAYRSARLLLVT